jgi:uncharacterized membrane protein YhaH (DUF805 family)
VGCEGLESGLSLLIIGIPGVLMWVLLAGYAAMTVERVRPAHRKLWLAAVWCVPILGALVWLGTRTITVLRQSACNPSTATWQQLPSEQADR